MPPADQDDRFNLCATPDLVASPPLTITQGQIDEAVATIDGVLGEVARLL